MKRLLNELIYTNILELCDAIVLDAVKEYKIAYKAKDYAKCDYLENTFFLTAYFESLTRGKIDAESLLREIRKEIDKGSKMGTMLHKRRTPNGNV